MAGDAASEEELLEVGRVTRPHGIRGDVVVELVSNRPERTAPGALLRGPAGSLEVMWSAPARPGRGRQRRIVRFRGFADREAAEALRGARLLAPPIADPGSWWVHELVGARVVDASGSEIGRVESVEANPASDLLVLGDGRLVPLRFVSSRAPGLLTIDPPPGLLDL